jgi:hypothetical protein
MRPSGPSSRAGRPAAISRLRRPRRFALLTRTPIPQKLPRINPQLVIVVEMKLDRVLAHAFRRSSFYGRLEHRKRPWRRFCGLSRLLVGLAALLVAKRAGTGIPQKWKGIMRVVAVFPLDIETRAGAEVHFYRLGVCHCRHEFSIAYPITPVPGRAGCSQRTGQHCLQAES